MPKKILWIVLSLFALSVILAACGGQVQQAVEEVAPTVEAAVEEAAPTVEAALEEAQQEAEAPAEEEAEAPAEEEVEEAVEEPAPEEAEEPAQEATEEVAEETTVEEPETGDEEIKIGFLAGVQDPFYFTMQRGAELAAADLGIELVTQIPEEWNATVQTPMLDALVARGDLDFLFLAPVDKEAMVAPLQAANDAGLPLLTVDTFIGDGDYAEGPVTFPLSYIGSDNVLGGYLGCQALAEAMGGSGKAYIQNVKPGISTTDQREEGCRQALDEYPDIELVGVDYNDDDPSKAQAQVQAMLQREPDLGGIFGTNVFSAQGAGQVVQNSGLSGIVKVVAFDATELAIELLREGTVDLVIAQKPADMGYLATMMATAYLNGVTSIPQRIPTGYAIIDQGNVDDPDIAKYIYTQ
jgi:ribose transport system substrate-binding protein